MLERARKAGMPFAWVTGDSVYGSDHVIRRCCEQHRLGCVLTVTSAQRLGLRPVTDGIEDLPTSVWQRLSGRWRQGPRLYDWTLVPYNVAQTPSAAPQTRALAQANAA